MPRHDASSACKMHVSSSHRGTETPGYTLFDFVAACGRSTGVPYRCFRAAWLACSPAASTSLLAHMFAGSIGFAHRPLLASSHRMVGVECYVGARPPRCMSYLCCGLCCGRDATLLRRWSDGDMRCGGRGGATIAVAGLISCTTTVLVRVCCCLEKPTWNPSSHVVTCS
jgi:hypothetical protein